MRFSLGQPKPLIKLMTSAIDAVVVGFFVVILFSFENAWDGLYAVLRHQMASASAHALYQTIGVVR